MDTPEKRKKPGRPRFEPTVADRKLVRILAGFGVPHDEIAMNIFHPDGKPISDRTLEKAFRVELATGKARLKGRAMKRMWNIIMSGGESNAARLLMFWLQSKQGWKPVSGSEHTGKDGGPIQTQDVSEMTREEKARAAAQAILTHYRGGGGALPAEIAAVLEKDADGEDSGTS